MDLKPKGGSAEFLILSPDLFAIGVRVVRYPPVSAAAIGIPALKKGYMRSLIHDLKIAFRNIRTRPSFSLMVIGMLALGIAGNAAIFSVFNSLFLRPLPFVESDRLIDLDETAPQWRLKRVGVSGPDCYEWRKSNSTFDSMAFFRRRSYNLSDGETSLHVIGAQVTREMLDVLGLKPAIGRNFLPGEDGIGGGKVALLGHGLWRQMFGSGVGLAANFAPALRAARVDPMRALHFE